MIAAISAITGASAALIVLPLECAFVFIAWAASGCERRAARKRARAIYRGSIRNDSRNQCRASIELSFRRGLSEGALCAGLANRVSTLTLLIPLPFVQPKDLGMLHGYFIRGKLARLGI
jgi:hypothetical protein